ncbi:hypothetical protein BpHYR1_015988 [Brachionus plicatilis]|uniref:Uncharacterized protein n=1 Tax=Brachionus plicatilis TaxID=10195 RepID=A0A3M7PAT6_BRAPC|nr:hypothetical protein BpHYR1_015988 [Brachionus plicatilis]
MANIMENQTILLFKFKQKPRIYKDCQTFCVTLIIFNNNLIFNLLTIENELIMSLALSLLLNILALKY